MLLPRPNLSQTPPEVVAYIEALEAEITRAAEVSPDRVAEEASSPSPADLPIAAESPTTLNVITVSAEGRLKRTPRHLYLRQRRGGMGVFDLETASEHPPVAVLTADEAQTLIVITNQARAFRLPVSAWPASPLRSRSQSLAAQLAFQAGEQPAVIVADEGHGYLALLTQQGYVRLLPYYIVGEKLHPETALYKVDHFGPPAAACWTSGNSDLFIATRQGLAIRFAEKLVPGPGAVGIRLDTGDAVAAIAAVQPADSVFLLGADGRGTLRAMAGFNPNKAPGAGGKLALKTDALVGAVAVRAAAQTDLFILSQLSKIIRFRADEVPLKEGVVQGVNCMALRADQTVAVCASRVA